MLYNKHAVGMLALSQLTAGIDLISTSQLGDGENICHAAIERNKSFELDYYELRNNEMFTDESFPTDRMLYWKDYGENWQVGANHANNGNKVKRISDDDFP
jgi:hypothetical protein